MKAKSIMRPQNRPIAMLTDQQLARLFAHLGVPVAVQALLESGPDMTDDSRLALHDMISAQTPDQALIAIAVSGLLIDARLRDQGQRCAEILAMASEMMVQDYAPIFLEHLNKHPHGTLFDRDDLEFLSTIPEDLENLSDLLAVVADVLPSDFQIYSHIALILSHQAQAQALVGETLVEAFGDYQGDALEATLSLQTDNIIPFRPKGK